MASASTVIWTAILSTLSLVITIGASLFFMGTRWAKIGAKVDYTVSRVDSIERKLEKMQDQMMGRH
jgi:hypothetical protein